MIEDTTAKNLELEKETQMITEDVTRFWGSLVQDDKFHQLNVQLEEAKAQLQSLGGFLKTISPLAQVTKGYELKELHHRVKKACTRQQQITTNFDMLQTKVERLALKEMEVMMQLKAE